MVRAFAGDSTMTSRRRAPSELTSSVLATVLLVVCRMMPVQLRVGTGGHPSSGTPTGGSPTSSRSRDSRRCPTTRYAGPSARGPTSTPATPAAASAAPTPCHAGSAPPAPPPPPSAAPPPCHAGWSLGPSARVYSVDGGPPPPRWPAARHHQRS